MSAETLPQATRRTEAEDQRAESLLESGNLLGPMLDLLERGKARSAQLHPGHSSLGRCRRAAGYGLAGTPADEGYRQVGSISSWIGTACHEAFLPALRELLYPARIELETVWRPTRQAGADPQLGGPGLVSLPPLPGHVDLYRRRSELVIDLKMVSRHGLNRVREEGPRIENLLQVHGNAASLSAEGKPVRHVGLLYVCTESSLDRQDGEGHLHLQEIDPELTAAAVGWWAEVAEAVQDLGDPEHLPRDERGPGLSWACDECPWLRRCWGADAEPGRVGAQALAAVESDAIASALAALADAQARKLQAGRDQRAAEADETWAAALLAGLEEGTYSGSAGAWTLSWTRGQLRLDQAAAIELLRELNVEAPRKRTASRPKAARAEETP